MTGCTFTWPPRTPNFHECELPAGHDAPHLCDCGVDSLLAHLHLSRRHEEKS